MTNLRADNERDDDSTDLLIISVAFVLRRPFLRLRSSALIVHLCINMAQLVNLCLYVAWVHRGWANPDGYACKILCREVARLHFDRESKKQAYKSFDRRRFELLEIVFWTSAFLLLVSHGPSHDVTGQQSVSCLPIGTGCRNESTPSAYFILLAHIYNHFPVYPRLRLFSLLKP